MKKFLLLGAVAAMAIAPAAADVITLESKNATEIVGTPDDSGNIIDMTSCKIGDYTFTFVAGSQAQASQTPRFWANDQTIRIYKGSQMTITGPADMNGIVFSAKNTNACKNFTEAVADQGTVVVASPDVTWTAATPAKTMTLTLPSNTNANFQIQTIKIYTGSDTPGSVTPPTPPEPEHATTVAELLAIANGTDLTFEGELVVSYANGPDCYVYDRTGATLLYSDRNDPWVSVLAPGTIITEFSGKRSDYNTTVEFIPVMNSLVTDGTAEVEAVSVTNAAEIEATAIDTYLRLANVTLSGIEGRNATANFTDGSTIPVYNRFCTDSYDPKLEYPAAAESYDIYALRSEYRGATQVNFVKADKVNAIETVDAESLVYVIGNSIVAPADAEIYSINGARVAADGLADGVYVVRTAGKAVKVMVK